MERSREPDVSPTPVAAAIGAHRMMAAAATAVVGTVAVATADKSCEARNAKQDGGR